MQATSGEDTGTAPQRMKLAAAPLLVPALIFLLIATATAFGAMRPLDNALMDLRFRLIERAPTGTLVLVEIDPYSIREEGRWPWPRDRYARAVENLQDAGAGLIAFDVDFASRSDAAGDEAFARALARRPGEVVLPVFWQWSRSGAGGELLKTPPNEKFLQHTVIASVTLTAEKNGVVRRGSRALADGAAMRTSMAGVLAGIPAGKHETFFIDFGIDAERIERLSFHDVAKGSFPAQAVRGKTILIGATALELGDEYAAPVRGVMPGVLFHALSYESLAQNRALVRPHPALPLALAGLLLFWLCRNAAGKRAVDLMTTNAVLLVIVLAVPVAAQAAAPVSFDAGVLLAAQAAALVYVLGARLRHRAKQIIAHRAATARYQALTGMVVRDNADGVIVTDSAGMVELCNERARELLGLGESGGSVRHISGLAAGFPVFTAGSGETAQREYAAKPGGPVLEILASSRIISAGRQRDGGGETGSELVVYTLRDISARKRIEEAERQAKDSAIAANTLKTQLISNMSHELRTPLNGVIGFAGILMNESFGPHGVAEYKEFSKSIHDSGKRLLGLVNDMLNIARLDAGEFEIAKDMTAMEDVIDQCLSPFEEEAERRNLSLRADVQKDMPDACIDASVVREILKHLLSNAFKFTDGDARIVVRARREGDVLLLEVGDNGCGADPASLPKLTEAFYQGDGSLSRAHEGAGLGLYLVSKYAAIHDGTLELVSEAGKGFTARLHLHGAFVTAAHSSGQRAAEDSPTGRKRTAARF